MKLTVSFLLSLFPTWPKSQDKNLNILRTKRAFNIRKAFFIIFKKLSATRNCLRPKSGLSSPLSSPQTSCAVATVWFLELLFRLICKLFFCSVFLDYKWPNWSKCICYNFYNFVKTLISPLLLQVSFPLKQCMWDNEMCDLSVLNLFSGKDKKLQIRDLSKIANSIDYRMAGTAAFLYARFCYLIHWGRRTFLSIYSLVCIKNWKELLSLQVQPSTAIFIKQIVWPWNWFLISKFIW